MPDRTKNILFFCSVEQVSWKNVNQCIFEARWKLALFCVVILKKESLNFCFHQPSVIHFLVRTRNLSKVTSLGTHLPQSAFRGIFDRVLLGLYPNFNQTRGFNSTFLPLPIFQVLPTDKNKEYQLLSKLIEMFFGFFLSQARTGYPFIDAIMTQLKQEGWIHHLARHAVACFLTRGDLWISWEEGLKASTRLHSGKKTLLRKWMF